MEEEEESQLSKQIKNKAKKGARKILISAMPAIAIMLIIIVIATSVFSIFTSVMEKMTELASNIKTNVTNAWKWITDDYWIKLDKQIEFTQIDEETRTGSNKNIYISR